MVVIVMMMDRGWKVAFIYIHVYTRCANDRKIRSHKPFTLRKVDVQQTTIIGFYQYETTSAPKGTPLSPNKGIGRHTRNTSFGQMPRRAEGDHR